ncbi:MAG: family 10 glycosylhydrolase [Oscillospiraceae bacterium]
MKAKFFISACLALTLLTGCVKTDLSDKTDDYQESNFEYSSEFPLSSIDTTSTDISSVIQTITSIEESSQASSQVSSTPVSSKQTSSKPNINAIVSSAVSSKPVSSQTASSKPVSSAVSSKPISSAVSSAPVSSAVSSMPVSSAPVSSTPEVAPPPVVDKHDTMKAVWLSFLEFDSFKNSSESGFRSKIQYYFDRTVGLGLNTVIVQIRPHGDSMYESYYYPWSKHISGTMGVGVSYDPLSIMIDEAHSRGLEIHAWINPYRTMTDTEFSTVSSNYLTRQWYDSPNRDSYMIKCGDSRWWLKPGNSEVVELITKGVVEIVSRYNVDGVHIDDYFYGAEPAKYGDSVSQAKANTTRLVKSIYDNIKAINSKVQFGISPFGGFKDNTPTSDINYLSTDLDLWCKNPGYIDYIMPQIYWEYDHKTQPFLDVFNKWQNFVTESSVDLYIGLGPYKLSKTIIDSQIEDILSSYRASGYALFRFDFI